MNLITCHQRRTVVARAGLDLLCVLNITPDTWPFFDCAFERSVRTLRVSIAVRKVVDRRHPDPMAKRQLTIAECLRRAKSVCANESLIIRARLYKIHFVAKKAESTLECLPDPDLAKFYSDDLPFPQAFHQEIALWKTIWNNSSIKPNSLVTTIADRNASLPCSQRIL